MVRRGLCSLRTLRRGGRGAARVMAADLDGSGVTVNLLLPAAPPRPGWSPTTLRPRYVRRCSTRAVMGPPIVWLRSPAAAGVHDQRIVATEFEEWLARR